MPTGERLPANFERCDEVYQLEVTYHFTFTGDEAVLATVVIQEQTVQVQEGHAGQANLRVIADSRTWLRFLAKERSLVWSLITRRIRLKGSPHWLLEFGKCFPS